MLESEVKIMMKSKSDILIALSVAAVVLSGVVSVFQVNVLSLAGTQWMLIGIVLGVYGLYAKLKA